MVYPIIHWDSSVDAVTWTRGWTISVSRFSEDTREFSLLQKVVEDSAAVRLCLNQVKCVALVDISHLKFI